MVTPTGLVRREPNTHDLGVSPDMIMWSLSSPVSLEGGPDDAPYAPMAGPGAANQVWRACALMALEVGGAWWPISQAMALEGPGTPQDRYGTVERIDPASAGIFSRPPWARDETASNTERILDTCMVEPGAWLDEAWTRLDGSPSLEDAVRSYLMGLRLLSFGHLYSEPAFLTLFAIFDGLGVGKNDAKRIKEAMQRSYARHFCPELRNTAPQAAAELFRLTYNPGRNPLIHDSRLLHLEGAGSGPLGDRPRDLDPTVPRMHVAVIGTLVQQARYLLRGQLGAPGPEPGLCIHTP
jgi:hypothetical protein